MTVLVGLMPVYGVLLSRVNLRGVWLFAAAYAAITGCALVYYFTGNGDRFLVVFYALAAVVYLMVHGVLTGGDFSRSLGFTMLIVYCLTGFWEIPVYLAGWLGFWGKENLGFMNQVYLVTALCIYFKFINFKQDFINAACLASTLMLSWVIIGRYQDMLTYAGNVWYICRVYSLAAMLVITWRSLKHERG